MTKKKTTKEKKITKELVNEFIQKYCMHCDAYVICGGEVAGCKDWNNFLKNN